MQRLWIGLGAAFVGLGVGFSAIREPLANWRQAELLLLGLGLLMGVGLLMAARRRATASRFLLVLVLAAGLLPRLVALKQEPSNDVYRYLWEGRIQLHGVNPYETSPNDPTLESLRDVHHGQINHPSWTAIYGPFMELGFAVLALLSPSVIAWKVVVLLGDLAVAGLLLVLLKEVRRNLLWVVGYWWNPLILWSFAGQAHLEVFAVVALLGALLLLRKNRHMGAGIALGLAILVKPTMALFVPLLVVPRASLPACAAAAATVLLGTIPYAGAGLGLLRSLLRFGAEMRFNDLPSWLLGRFLGGGALRLVAALVLVMVVLWLWRRRAEWSVTATALAGAFLLVAPTVHPWYAAPLVACCCLHGTVAWWVLTITLLLSVETTAVEAATGVWREVGWVRAAVYGPFLATAAVELARRALSGVPTAGDPIGRNPTPTGCIQRAEPGEPELLGGETHEDIDRGDRRSRS